MAEEDGKKIEIYREAIKKEDRVSEEEYEERLTRCKQCELLNAGTCGAVVVGMMFDATGGYKIPWLVMSASLLAATIMRAIATSKRNKCKC